MRIEGGRALLESGLEETSVHVDCESGMITGLGAQASAERAIDASGLLILPGIVDIHGDAFERQMMPRPGVGFPIDVALLESDLPEVSNGGIIERPAAERFEPSNEVRTSSESGNREAHPFDLRSIIELGRRRDGQRGIIDRRADAQLLKAHHRMPNWK